MEETKEKKAFFMDKRYHIDGIYAVGIRNTKICADMHGKQKECISVICEYTTTGSREKYYFFNLCNDSFCDNIKDFLQNL